MTYKVLVDSFHQFLRVAICDADSILTFRLFDLQVPSLVGGIYPAQIQRVVPSLQSVWVQFEKDRLGFLKSPKRPFVEGEWIMVEILKDADAEKKYLVKERSDLKVDCKLKAFKEPPHPFLRLCDSLGQNKISSIFCTSDVFSSLQDSLSHSAYISKLELYKKQNLFQEFDLDEAFDSACLEEVEIESFGSLIVEEGRTLTAIDLNMKGEGGESSFERAAFTFNLKACDYVWDQIRHRNLGGLILVDFLRMKDTESRQKIFQKMKDLSKKDRIICDVLGFTKAGLFELSRFGDRQSLKKIMGDLWKKL